MSKRSAEDLWERLVDEAGEDEVERAVAVSVAQAEEELARAGFDVAAERARAEARVAGVEGRVQPESGVRRNDLETKAVESPARDDVVRAEASRRARRVAGPGPRRWGRASVVAAWMGATAAAAAGLAAYTGVLEPMLQSARQPSPADLATAADLRRRAAAALDAGRPAECLTLLDRARDLDRGGDAAPDVRRLRERSAQGEPNHR